MRGLVYHKEKLAERSCALYFAGYRKRQTCISNMSCCMDTGQHLTDTVKMDLPVECSLNVSCCVDMRQHLNDIVKIELPVACSLNMYELIIYNSK